MNEKLRVKFFIAVVVCFCLLEFKKFPFFSPNFPRHISVECVCHSLVKQSEINFGNIFRWILNVLGDNFKFSLFEKSFCVFVKKKRIFFFFFGFFFFCR